MWLAAVRHEIKISFIHSYAPWTTVFFLTYVAINKNFYWLLSYVINCKNVACAYS